MTQQQARLERIERIAQLLRGPVSGRIERGDVYFDAKAQAHAEAIAKQENRTNG